MTTQRTPAPYEVAALRAFSDAHGKKWREELTNAYWYNARIWRDASGSGAHGEALHGIRNSFGPSWLHDVFRLPEEMDKPDREVIPVIFRLESASRGVKSPLAIFPTLPGTHDPFSATCYAHIGQHGTTCQGYAASLKAARPDQYAPLLAELRRIYEEGDEPVYLAVTTRWTRHHDKARRAALAATGREA